MRIAHAFDGVCVSVGECFRNFVYVVVLGFCNFGNDELVQRFRRYFPFDKSLKIK